MQEFCPRCGKETKDLVKGLCVSCFLEKFRPVEFPSEIVLEKCKHCGKIKSKGNWVLESDEALAGIVLQSLKNKLFDSFKPRIELFERENGFKALVRVSGKIRKVRVEQAFSAVLKQKTVLCDFCMKLSSNYFEATVQVRFSGKKTPAERFEEVASSAEKFLNGLKKADSLAAVVKFVELKNGFDLVIGGNRAAKQLAEFLARKGNHKKITTSATLAGVDRKGHNWSRFTYCVRL